VSVTFLYAVASGQQAAQGVTAKSRI